VGKPVSVLCWDGFFLLYKAVKSTNFLFGGLKGCRAFPLAAVGNHRAAQLLTASITTINSMKFSYQYRGVRSAPFPTTQSEHITMKRQVLLGIAFSIFALNAFAVTETDPLFSDAVAATETDPLFSDAVAATETDPLFSDAVAATETDPLFSDAVASDGSDHLQGNRVAEGGADRLIERRAV
jgi:hypothetical protein